MTQPAELRATQRRIVHLAEGSLTPRSAKTTRGVLKYSPHLSVGVIDSTNVGKSAHQLLGCGEGVPVSARLADFMSDRPDVLLVGITNPGGKLPREMRPHVAEALEAGLDVWNGLHEFLAEDPEFGAIAAQSGSKIWDVRRAPRDLPVGTGACVSAKSYICLTVGTDCAVGKMTASLELQSQVRHLGRTAEFVATGQTGIMISGWGHPIDAIAGDFMAGAVEKDCMSVDGRVDVTFVEGQGSLLHPGFSSVTLGLLHGCMPAGLVLCHEMGRTHISKREHILIPSLTEMADIYIEALRPFRKTEILGVCLNTWGKSEEAARAACDAAAKELGVPATDPCRFGCEAIAKAVLSCLNS